MFTRLELISIEDFLYEASRAAEDDVREAMTEECRERAQSDLDTLNFLINRVADVRRSV